jgi:hypothetical protein
MTEAWRRAIEKSKPGPDTEGAMRRILLKRAARAAAGAVREPPQNPTRKRVDLDRD